MAILPKWSKKLIIYINDFGSKIITVKLGKGDK